MERMDIKVRMRDAIALMTTVFLPSVEGGPWPLLLERTPYGRLGKRPGEKTSRSTSVPIGEELAREFCNRGFAVALQDCRGRYDSEGDFEKYTLEGEDSHDTIVELGAMDWCNGWVATFGQSYSALVQTAVGPLNPPGLGAQVIDSGGFTNAWRNGLRQNGVLEMKQAVWIVREAANSPLAKMDGALSEALLSQDLNSWFEKMPWTSGSSPICAHPEYESLLIKLFDPSPQDQSWVSTALATERHFEAYKKLPMLFVSSWYDPYARTISEMYAGLKQRQQCNIILGPWTHCDQNKSVAGDVDFGPSSLIDSWAGSWVDFRLRFFDSAMKNEAFEAPPARIFLMGGGSGRRTPDGHLDHGGKWFDATDWPVPDTIYQTLFLNEEQRLDNRGAQVASACSFDYDPAHPVPTVGGDFSSFSPYLTAGAFDQVLRDENEAPDAPVVKLSDRADVCVFRSDALKSELCIAGPVDYEIWVTSDADDTDFTLKFIDEYPPSEAYPEGYAMLLGDTIMRLKYSRAQNRDKETSGMTCISGTLCWTANLFAVQHRLRIDISSSNFPKFERNSNTSDAASPKVARNTIHLGGKMHNSKMRLPTLPEHYWK